MKLFDAFRKEKYDIIDVRLDYSTVLMETIQDFIQIIKNKESLRTSDLIYLLSSVYIYYHILSGGKDILEDTYKVLYKKTMDYNAIKFAEGNFEIDDAREDYFPFGDESYLHMIYTKINRIVNLAAKDSEPNFEGIADSLIDCAAYLSFYYSYLLKREKLNNAVN